MSALISAELLRIRTLRVTRYVVVGMLGLGVMLAVFPPSGGLRSALVDSVRSVTFTFVMAAAFIAATQLGTEFKRGAAALTYLAHPNRRTVATARVLTYGLIGGLLAALAAIVALIAGVAAAHFAATRADIGAQAIARVIGGAAFGGATLGGFGALIGTVTREPILATVAVVTPTLIAAPLPAVSPYLPFGLAEQLLGGADKVAAPLAMILLLAYVAVTALCVRRWALPRDLP
jgi:ABC-type transport system involved in multi-copper enzyme maturation permease subunit